MKNQKYNLIILILGLVFVLAGCFNKGVKDENVTDISDDGSVSGCNNC